MSIKKGSAVNEKVKGRMYFVSTEEAEIMFRAFRHALNNIKVLRSDMASIRLDTNSGMEFNALKYRLNKYSLFGSDCSWRSHDADLQHIIDSIDMCCKLLLMKSIYTLGDVTYVYKTLSDVEETINIKMAELEEMYSL